MTVAKHTKSLNIFEVNKIYNSTKSLQRAAEVIGCGRSKLQAFCAKHNIKRKYALDHKSFSDVTTNACYWAGFIAADGCVYKHFLKIALQKGDFNHLNKFFAFLKSNNKARIRGTSARFCIRSKQITLDLLKYYNITPKKSLTLLPPNICGIELEKNFIRGYVDGDGCIYFTPDKGIGISVVGGAKSMIEWIRDVIYKRLSIDANITLTKCKGYDTTYYTINYSRKRAETILKWLYEHVDVNFCLIRKLNKYYKAIEIRRCIDLKKQNLKDNILKMKQLYNSGMTYQQVADRMGFTYGKVSYHLSRATDIIIYRGCRKNGN